MDKHVMDIAQIISFLLTLDAAFIGDFSHDKV